jgi:protein-tyrosine phosphatase
MASLLRQIVAGPRSRHPEAGLDLCYVTSQIIATSGPSGTYPQRAYRNPLDQLVKFLDYKHGDGWAIWEFRAEGTGYPDEEVYGRIRHYPWPDHHPPPFKLIPMIMAGMRNWLNGEDDVVVQGAKGLGKEGSKKGRVVVVHCKAGKGRSGTMACSYLISECGWKPEEALARFTERRMRPGFGQGVSIPSQLRWVGYVDRWTKSGKVYVERQIEIMEVHVWGLRDGVKVQVEGYVDEGKTIKLFHVFTKKERVVVEGNAPGGNGIKDMISDMAGFQNQANVKPTKTQVPQVDGTSESKPRSLPEISNSSSSTDITGAELGGNVVIFKPSTRVILPTSDINIDFERRNKASMGWTMVTSVAHVWFNTFFEGSGPENNGIPNENGVFEIEWDKMDGIRGSSKKGTRAFDHLAVIWKAYSPPDAEGGERGRTEEVIHEPGLNSPVPQMQAADWKGGHETSPGLGAKNLGLRTESPRSAEVSKASSVKSAQSQLSRDHDNDSEEGILPAGLQDGEDVDVDLSRLPQPQATASEPTLEDVDKGLDTASSTTPQVPFGELKDAKEHRLGHLQASKRTIDS